MKAAQRKQRIQHYVTQQMQYYDVIRRQFSDDYNELIAPYRVSLAERALKAGLDKLAVHPPSDKRIDPIPEETLKRALSYTPSKEDPARRQLEERKALEAAAKAKKQKQPRRKRPRAEFSESEPYDSSYIPYAVEQPEPEGGPTLTEHDIKGIVEPIYEYFFLHPDLKTPELKKPFRSNITPETCAQVGLPNYFEKCEVAMTLHDVKKRLQSSSPPYSTLEEFANDMRLMFNNTLAYYDVYSPQYQVASKLKGEFEEKWRTVIAMH